MLRLAAEREALNVVADQWGAPTSAGLLANVTAQLLLQPITAAQLGLYHVSASGRTNWHAYACRVIERARVGLAAQSGRSGSECHPDIRLPHAGKTTAQRLS